MSSKIEDPPLILPHELVQWLERHSIVAEVRVSHADGSALDEATLAQLHAHGNRMAERRSHLERLASMGEVSASMAHEARNVLAGINGLCQLKTPADGEERTQLIRSEIERCTRLLSNFLSFTSGADTRLSPLSAEATLEPVRLLLESEAKSRRCELITRVASGTPLFQARAHELRQVMFNLALNALQAVPEGGTVQLLAEPAAAHVSLQVIDDGAGILPEVLLHLFEPFVTSRADRGGTGLGLSTALRLVRGMGGTLTAENQSTGGARFEVRLPVAEAAPLSRRQAP
ncbi:MAG TPA: ATP-binding protein [Polyangiaceae bacterium]|nr:ATP-binding protein [Polyangiaceae bacterium]